MKTIPKPIRVRVLIVGIMLSVFISIIAGKTIYLQVYRGEWLAKRAANQYEKSIVSHAKRGTIYDANHRAMAVSIDGTSIAAFPRQIHQPKTAARKLSKILKLKRKSVYSKITAKKNFVWLKRQISPTEAKSVKALDLKGIGFIPEGSRFYPNRTLAAQILGFTGVDGRGLEGLEYYYDTYLKGEAIEHTILRDALGRGFGTEKGTTSRFSGHNLVLTIDGTIQYITEKALEEAVKRYKGKSGLAIVMSPKTGALLAIAHFPTFNPNTYREFHKKTWRNRAITDPFEPGSTMKIFSAAAALESGLASPNTIFYCENGAYRIGKNTVHDVHAHGWLSLQQIVKFSSNIGAVKVGEMIGPEYHYKMLKAFGFGIKSGLDSPGETNGTLSPYKRWSKIDAGAISFGQGISVSALQLISATSAIANDGILMKPYIVQAVSDADGNIIKKMAPRKIRRVLSSQTTRALNRIMQTVITQGGTGMTAALDSYTVCGKTGTAQKTDSNGKYAKGKYVSSFIGFAPAENPAVTILVVVTEPNGQYYGGTVAGPAFKIIAHETLSYLNVPPSKTPGKLRVSREGASLG